MEATGTLVYVHGASDRGAQVDDHVARIEAGLRLARLPLAVVAARWGEEAGARLDRIDLALPLLSRTTTPEAFAPVPTDAPLRALLADGPLSELDRLASAARLTTAGAEVPREADQLLEICRTQVGAADEMIAMANGSQERLALACRVAAQQVAESDEYIAAQSAVVSDTQLVAAAGRAVAASVATHAAQPLDVLGTVQLRIAEAVLGAAGATLLAGYLGIDVGPGLKRWATDVLLPHRARLMRDAALGPADILLYQRDGQQVRAVVARALHEARARGGPIVALGNSLGGIILVDLLAQPDSPRPDLLVTVGSQAPLLETFGALHSGAGDLDPFQPWLNIYDRRDLLGFVAGRVWATQADITDREVDLGVGFPDAHGATYLAHTAVYGHIRDHPAMDGVAGAADDPVLRFAIGLGPRSRLILRLLFGVTQGNAYIDINRDLDAHFGRFRLRTPLSNVRSWRIEGPWLWITAIGVRRGLRHGDVTFAGNHAAGVRLDFGEPVRWGVFFRAPALYVSVADVEGFAAALAARGIPGHDARRDRSPMG